MRKVAGCNEYFLVEINEKIFHSMVHNIFMLLFCFLVGILIFMVIVVGYGYAISFPFQPFSYKVSSLIILIVFYPTTHRITDS